MIIVKTIENLQKTLKILQKEGKSIGFVPTMGALHQGHISLITQSKQENNLTVCSIFVNPTQFNNATDLAKYPRTIENDINFLEKANCDLLFLPEVEEMYPSSETLKKYDLGYLETVLEGEHRPGHFQGVCIIVDKLLQAVKPTTLYLGRKDFQQCMVVKKMMQKEHANINLVFADTVRENSGLAMSSRNMRLNEGEKRTATTIFECLNYLKTNIGKGSLQQTKQKAIEMLQQKGFVVDYVEIVNEENLEIVENWNSSAKLSALVAATLNQVRLIDNMSIS
jgi:pantoate--beta-alanine ligase